jgi:hypothetical protein
LSDPPVRPQDPLPMLNPFEDKELMHRAYEAAQRERAAQDALEKGRGSNITKVAMREVGSTAWNPLAAKEMYGPGTDKCNLFVYDVLNAAGTPVYLKVYHHWVRSDFKYPPLAGQWADPNVEILGWKVVTDPQPGDVAAEAHDCLGCDSGHVGIVISANQTVSASTVDNKVVANDWGFRPDQKGHVVFRRYVGIEK